MVAFIEAFRGQFGVEPICRALRAGVAISPSGYYAARARPRAVREAALEKQILRVFKDSGERYGAWKVWDQLNREGIAAARCTVERLMRLMRLLGLRGLRRGGWKKPRTTVPDLSQQRPTDLVNRDFGPEAPDRAVWPCLAVVLGCTPTRHPHQSGVNPVPLSLRSTFTSPDLSGSPG
ncbi:MAG: IS3 family transposase [Streptosporangiaceae bacterium]